jgi:hypothetical protein
MSKHSFLRSCALFLAAVDVAACDNSKHEPHMESRPITQAETGVQYQYVVRADFDFVPFDGSGTELRYSLDIGPSGMVMLNEEHLLVWTPTLADLGVHVVKIRVADERGTEVDQQFELRVHQGLQMGTKLSWRGHTSSGTQDDLQAFLQHHAPWGRVIGFRSNWRDPGAAHGAIPVTLALAAGSRADGFLAELDVGWADPYGDPDLASDDDPGDNSWTNAQTRADFLTMVVAAAAELRPDYLFLGEETNHYYLSHSADEWSAWISEYEACYDAIKAVSPATRVSTIFQLERMKGLGAKNGWSDAPQWSLVDALAASGKADVAAFTCYPYFEFDALDDIPAGYFDEIAQHWSGRVAYAEIGWLAAPSGDYPGDEPSQSDFVTRFLDQNAELRLELADWLFLHDWDGQASTPAYANVGLRDNLATTIRPADATWQATVALRQR